jgi:hypothetical protein
MSSEPPSVDSPRQRILGTWRMLSWTRRLVPSGEESDAVGPNPFGYVNYAPDGRVMVFVLRSARRRPSTNPSSEAEKIALFDSMFAYVGTCEVGSDRVIHKLDGSWNELWTGTRQTRLLSFANDHLIYGRPRPAKSGQLRLTVK